MKELLNNICPQCGQSPEIMCRCPKGDSRCKNGHWWHTCLVHNCIVSGKSNHARPTYGCSCGETECEKKMNIIENQTLILYTRLIEPLRMTARAFGYALATHGSLSRDIDLIACPWTEDATNPRSLVMALLETVKIHNNGVAHFSWHPTQGEEFTLSGGPGIKPHGRLGWVINLTMDDGPYIDLAVMPKIEKEQK